MEIDKVQVLKPFGPLVMMAQLPEGFIKKLNGIAEVVKEKGDMGPRLAGVIKKESEIPHSMLEEKKCMDIFHALSRSYIEQAYINGGQKIYGMLWMLKLKCNLFGLYINMKMNIIHNTIIHIVR